MMRLRTNDGCRAARSGAATLHARYLRGRPLVRLQKLLLVFEQLFLAVGTAQLREPRLRGLRREARHGCVVWTAAQRYKNV